MNAEVCRVSRLQTLTSIFGLGNVNAHVTGRLQEKQNNNQNSCMFMKKRFRLRAPISRFLKGFVSEQRREAYDENSYNVIALNSSVDT